MADDDLDGVVFNIRACIGSSKGPVNIRNLMRDYETLVGSQIPYRKFSHNTLESFLQSLPSLRVCGSGRDTLVEAAADKASSHMTSLIAKQKTSKPSHFPNPRRGPPPPSRFTRPRGGGAPRYSSSNYAPRQYNSYSEPRRDYAPPRSYTSTYEAPRLQPRVSNKENVEPMLRVKVDSNEKRQVSMAESSSLHKPSTSSSKSRYEVPPRLQKKFAQPSPPSNSSAVVEQLNSPTLQVDQNRGISYDFSNNKDLLISPFSPGEMVAAGLAKQQAEQADLLSQTANLTVQSHKSFVTEVIDFTKVVSQTTALDNQQLFAESMDILQDSTVIPVPKADLVIVTNNTRLILDFALARKWSVPEYTLFTRKPKHSAPIYGASVKISGSGQGVKKYSSYPHEDFDPDVAKGYAAMQALIEIGEDEKVKLDRSKISTDKNTICDRVSEIVAKVYNGMFAKTVEDMYEKRYNEFLPDDWIQLLINCPTVTVESTLNSHIIVPRDPETDPVQVDPSLEPPPLETPVDDIWDVYVTYATATDCVWFRLIGENYSDKYEELMISMDTYYKNNSQSEIAQSIELGQYYIAISGECISRVYTREIKEDNKMVQVWFIDHGDVGWFHMSSLYRLHPSFYSVPRQAIPCILEGLENFSQDEIASEIISNNELLIGQSLIAQIHMKDEENGCVKATLYDTSGTDDVNLNELLLDVIVQANSEPKLPNESRAIEVYVSSVSKRGEVYIQLPSPAYDQITEILESLDADELKKHQFKSFREIALNKIYLAKYSKDENWYRAVVTAMPSMTQNKIAIRFVDFGNSETVTVADLVDTTNLMPILSKLPPQAIKVSLHKLPIETLANAEIAKLHSLLMDEEKTVLIKTINLQEEPPVVEIFYKNDAENKALVSVNHTIELQRLLYRPDGKKSPYLPQMNGSNNDSMFYELKKPEFDEDFLAVNIMFSANPGNFIFQPLKYAKELKSLMCQLQAYYEATALPEITKDEIIKGRIFAARHPNDQNWYRVVVNEAIIGSVVPVRLCDFGDVEIVPISNFRELETDFRKVPFLAVKGRLAGVSPLHKDWAVEDCIRFSDLVDDKVLASLVMGVEENFLNPMEMVVSLHLIDTNSDEDIVIADILISENRAVKDRS